MSKKCDYEVVYTNHSNNEDERVVLNTEDVIWSLAAFQYVPKRRISIISVNKIPPKEC